MCPAQRKFHFTVGHITLQDRVLAVVHNAVQRCSDGSAVPKDTDKNKSITVSFHVWEPIKRLSWQKPLKLVYRERVDSNSEDLLGVLSHLSPLKLGSGFVSSAGGKVSYICGVSPTLKWDGSLPVLSPSLSLPLSLFILSWNPNCYPHQVCLVDPKEGQSPFRKRLDPI